MITYLCISFITYETYLINYTYSIFMSQNIPDLKYKKLERTEIKQKTALSLLYKILACPPICISLMNLGNVTRGIIYSLGCAEGRNVNRYLQV